MQLPSAHSPIRNIAIAKRHDGPLAPLTNEQKHQLEYTRDHRAGIHTRFLHFETRIRGPLDVERLRASVVAVAQRHEALRTRIVIVDGLARQLIDAAPQLRWEFSDLSPLAPTEFEREVVQQFHALLNEPIDLTADPLFAVRLFRRSSAEHVFIAALSHMITDMMSNAILNGEIWSCYSHTSVEAWSRLPPPRFHYADYAIWENRTGDEWLREHGAYWKAHLRGATPLRMPVEPSYKRIGNPEHVSTTISFGRELTDALRALAKTAGTSLALVVLAVYVAAMSRWCDQRDLLVAFTSHSRFCTALLRMVGNLAMGLTLRIAIGPTDTYTDLLRRIHEELDGAYAHWDFNRVPDLLPLPPFGGSIFFDWIPTLRANRALPHDTSDAITLEPFPLQTPAAAHYVMLFAETSAGVIATLTYERGLFRASVIARLERYIGICAHEMTQHPESYAVNADP